MSWRRAARWARAHALEWSGVNARRLRGLDGQRAAVLFYHRVLPREIAARDAVEPGMFVTPRTFAHHLDWLTERLRVLPLHEVTTHLSEGRSLPAGACAITFDDGWRDNLEYALPELSRRGVPATLFVVTERVGTADAFWPDEVCRRFALLAPEQQQRIATELGARGGGTPLDATLAWLKAIPETERAGPLDRLRAATPQPEARQRELLDRDELATLSRQGVDIESHGATHAILTRLDEAGVAAELRASRDWLREHGFGQHDLLAYPSGGWSPQVASVARQVGFRAAVTIDPGFASPRHDALALPRIGFHEDVSSLRAEFLHRLAGAA